MVMTTETPRPVGWCDEHARYFYWRDGCGPRTPKPTGADVRAWYQQRPHEPARVTAVRIRGTVTPTPASVADADEALPRRSVAVRAAFAFGEWSAP